MAVWLLLLGGFSMVVKAQTVPSQLIVWKKSGAQTTFELQNWPQIVATSTQTTITTRNGGTTTMATTDVHKMTLGGSATTYTLSIQASSGGTVSYNSTSVSGTTKTFSVSSGASATLKFTPSTGYYLSKLTVGGVDKTSSVSSNQYTISSITANTSVVATFTKYSYTLSIQASSGGSVTYSSTTVSNTTKTFSVSYGTSATLTFTPSTGYYLSKLTVGGTDVTSSVSSNSYTISSITANTTVVATFAKLTYTLSIQAGSGGAVTYSGTSFSGTTKTYTVEYGTSATLTFSPNSGYYLSKLTVGGTDKTSSVSSNSYTISSITANTTVVATFAASATTNYTLSIQSSSGGTVSYNSTTFTNSTKQFTVSSGASATLTFSANSGYYLSKLTVGGVDVTSSITNNSYTISSITANTFVIATFTAATTYYTLSLQASSGGSITYGSTTFTNSTKQFSVASGSSATLTFTPNSGYYLSKLTVGGVDKTSSVSNNQYTISSLSANTTVIATFSASPTTYTLSIQASSGGTVSYNGTSVSGTTSTFTVQSGASATLTFSANTGYYLSKLTVGGTDVTSSVQSNQYTISSLSANTSVVATFTKYTYTLSIQASSGGTVNYSGTSVTNTTKTFSVSYGASATLTITPNTGYYLSKLTVGGTNRTSSVSNNSYTISSITANTAVVATFSSSESTYTTGGITYTLNASTSQATVTTSSSSGEITIPSSITYSGTNYSVTAIASNAFSGSSLLSITVPSSITTVGTGIFDGCTTLAAVVWNPSMALSNQMFGARSNPNLLLYVKNIDYAPQGINNLVINGTAPEITLTEASSGNNFYCPQAFTATSISYTHNYTMQSGNGTTQGWETLCLPFAVQTIKHEAKGTIVPFAAVTDIDNERPFWLYRMTTSGWTKASSVEANTPYVISMPNNDAYDEKYHLNGQVTFSASNVKMPITSLKSVTHNSKSFTGNYTNQTSGSTRLALNVVNDYGSYKGNYTEGSGFVSSPTRTIHPFEAYLSTSSSAKQYVPLFDELPSAIDALPTTDGAPLHIYTLSGQQVVIRSDATLNQVKQQLPAGVYIVNGKKMVIK